MASEDCDWPVEGKMSHIVDSVYMYLKGGKTYFVDVHNIISFDCL